MKICVLKLNPRFWAMLKAWHQQSKTSWSESSSVWLVGLDPGETTGFAVWNPVDKELYLTQLITKSPEEGFKAIKEAIRLTVPNIEADSDTIDAAHAVRPIIVCEDYKVYGWKADSHKWAGLHTPQLIGAIRVLAMQEDYPIHFQMAQEAKSWATDSQLTDWGAYEPGQRHARDASRHILRYMFFGFNKSGST